MDSRLRHLELCVVEDEADLRDELVEALSEAGFGVRGFAASRELYAALQVARCDIAILDIGLPGEDGYAIASRLHSMGKMGIIILSARTDLEDRVRALQGGADVYLTKPVDLRELTAVVTSLARRLELPDSPTISKPEKRDAVPPLWSLTHDRWALVAPNGIFFPLTAQERTFLTCLWQREGEAVAREDLAIALGGDPYEYDFHRLDTLVSRLRRKAADLQLNLPLRAVRGKGYVVSPGLDHSPD